MEEIYFCETCTNETYSAEQDICDDCLNSLDAYGKCELCGGRQLAFIYELPLKDNSGAWIAHDHDVLPDNPAVGRCVDCEYTEFADGDFEFDPSLNINNR